MAKPKEERNQQFIICWKKEGLSNKALGKKFNLALSGVKSLKGRLRKSDPSLYIKPPASKLAIQQTNKQERKLPAKELYETVTYYITKEQKQRVKLAALQQDKEISQLVREILSDYFDRQ